MIVVIFNSVGVLEDQILGLGDFDFLRFSIGEMIGILQGLLLSEPQAAYQPKTDKRRAYS